MDTRIGIENDNRTFKSSRRDSSPPLYILYYNISGYNSSAQFLLCCTGVLVFYLIYGYLQVGLGLNFMFIILSLSLICIFKLHVLMHFSTCQINLTTCYQNPRLGILTVCSQHIFSSFLYITDNQSGYTTRK